MIDFFFPTNVMGSQTLRLVAEAQQGGGDVFDIARLCRDLDPNDKKGWERAQESVFPRSHCGKVG